MPTKYISYSQRQNLQETVKRSEKVLNDPALMRSVERRDRFVKQYKQDKEDLSKVTPPDVTDDKERVVLVDRLKSLEEAMVEGRPDKGVEPMLSRREMEENPPGAIGRLTRFHNVWKNWTLAGDNKTMVQSSKGYGAEFEWKDKRKIVFKDREESDADVGNLEILRPDGPDNASLRDYRRRSYAPFLNLSYEEYDKLELGHKPTDVELKIRAMEKKDIETESHLEPDRSPFPETNGKPLILSPESSVLESSVLKPITGCQYRKRDGTLCGRKLHKDSRFCSIPTHKTYVVKKYRKRADKLDSDNAISDNAIESNA